MVMIALRLHGAHTERMKHPETYAVSSSGTISSISISFHLSPHTSLPADGMGNMNGIMAVGAVMAYGAMTGTTIPTWVLVVVFVVARFVVPMVLGLLGGAKEGTPAAPLDDTVLMMQGTRPTPGVRGKVVVIERWATWCPPCVASIPHINKLFEKYSDRDDFQIVGVTNETDQAKIRAFMAEHDMRYPVAVDSKGVVGAGYPSSGIPNATIIGRNGRVFWNGHPMGMDAPLAEAMNGAVKGPEGDGPESAAAGSASSFAGAAATTAETKRTE